MNSHLITGLDAGMTRDHIGDRDTCPNSHLHGKDEIRFRWYIRWLFVPFLAWGTTRLPASRVRELFDEDFAHRDDEWRQQLWALVAERMTQ